MVCLNIMGMTSWVNPFLMPVRRPWTLSVARRRPGGAFFCGKLEGFDLWGLRRVVGGSRWRDAAHEAPVWHTPGLLRGDEGATNDPSACMRACAWEGEPWGKRFG
jgi:hypothetical protein